MATRPVSPFTRERAKVMAYNGHLWARGTSKRTGERFYLIPSTTDPEHVAYYATASGCTCPGFRNRGACIHSEAVAQFEARQQRAAASKPRPRYEDLVPAECGAQGCDRPVVSEGSCKVHELVDAF